MLWCRKEGQSGDGGCSLRWSGEHTLIYRGCPVGGSPFHGGGINKIGIHRVVTLVTLPHAPPPLPLWEILKSIEQSIVLKIQIPKLLLV